MHRKAFYLFFSKRTFNARYGKRMFFKMFVLCTLLDVGKVQVYQRMLNMHSSIRAFNSRLTLV